jgi:putative transposase
VHLRILRLRHGSFLPVLLEPRRRADRALANVVAEAYVAGVSTRKVDQLVQALGLDGMDKSTVSRLASVLDEEVAAFRSRPLSVACPSVWLDDTFPKVREGGRVVNMALMIAVGVTADGARTILGLELGASEDGSHWRALLRSLRLRPLGKRQVTAERLRSITCPSCPSLTADPPSSVGHRGSMRWNNAAPERQMVLAKHRKWICIGCRAGQ